MLENWAEINDYPIYYISNKGRVYNLVKRELVQPTILDGVLTVVLQDEYDPPVTHEVQKLVSEHFPKSDEEEDGYFIWDTDRILKEFKITLAKD